jgi:hypothetical protein
MHTYPCFVSKWLQVKILRPRPLVHSEQFHACIQSVKENAQLGLKPSTTAFSNIIIIIIIIIIITIVILEGFLSRPLHNTFKWTQN